MTAWSTAVLLVLAGSALGCATVSECEMRGDHPMTVERMRERMAKEHQEEEWRARRIGLNRRNRAKAGLP